MVRPTNSRYEDERDRYLTLIELSKADIETTSETSQQTSTGDQDNGNQENVDIGSSDGENPDLCQG